MTSKGGRRKRQPRRNVGPLAKAARDRLDGALREAHTSERNAASLAINACIRACDAICVAARGEHAVGDDHREAVALLETVPDGRRLAKLLGQALADKTEIDYGIRRLPQDALKRVLRAAAQLVATAEERATALRD